jgi:hypothetical protein
VIVQLSLETFGDHLSAAAAEAEMRALIAAYPEFTDIVSPPGITIGRYQTTLPRNPAAGRSHPIDVIRYNAYATLVKPEQP